MKKSAIKHCNYAVITLLHGGIFRLSMVLGVCALITVFFAFPVRADEFDDLANSFKMFVYHLHAGDAFRKRANFVGAVREYELASEFKDDPALHEKLADVYRVRDENDKAIKHYLAAAKLKDSAAIQIKLGQAYQAKKDIPKALSCYAKAEAWKIDDPDVQEALVSGWEEALKDCPEPSNRIYYHDILVDDGMYRPQKSIYEPYAFNKAEYQPQKNLVSEKLLADLAKTRETFKATRWINIGVSLQTEKKFDSALEAYQHAFRLSKEAKQQSDILLNMGTVYQAMGQRAKASEAYSQALSIDKSNTDAVEGVRLLEGTRQISK